MLQSLSRRAALFLIVLLATGRVAAQSVDLPVTGDTQPVTSGDDGSLQYGRTWPTNRFLDNGDGTVSDRLTGLMWLKHATCLGKKAIGSEAVNAVATLNSQLVSCAGYTAKHTNWHLPTINELVSLYTADANNVNSAGWLALQGFNFASVDTPQFWSSTSRSTSSHYLADFSDDGVEVQTSGSYWIWAVRPDPSLTPVVGVPNTGQTSSYYSGDDGELKPGVAWPQGRFKDNGDGTVLDNLTGLTWLKDANCMNAPYYGNMLEPKKYGKGAVTWLDAVAFAAQVNGDTSSPCWLDGGWRLPNRVELRSLIDHQTGSVPSNTFLNLQTNVWSSTGGTDGNAWRLTTSTGVQARLATTNTAFVMLVRGGFKSTFNVTVDAQNEMLPFVQVGETSTTLTITVTNSGNEPQTFPDLSVSGTGAPQFKLIGDSCSMKSLDAAATCTVQLAFAPTQEGFALAKLDIPYRSGLSTLGTRSVTLRGNAWNGPHRAFVRRTGQVTVRAGTDDATWKAGVRWPEPRFKDNGDGTVRDRLTGLTWMKNASCFDNGNGENYSTVQGDLDKLNNGELDCGDYKKGTFGDWRIPNVNELLSLYNFEYDDQSTFLQPTFQHVGQNGYFQYWTSTTNPNSPYNFELRFEFGGVSQLVFQNSSNGRLWPVRGISHGPAPTPKTGLLTFKGIGEDGWFQFGVPWPEPRFTNNGDGTFTDALTGLTWIRNLSCIAQTQQQSRLDYNEALTALGQLNSNPAAFTACGNLPTGVSDWRIPNILELLSLADWTNREIPSSLFDSGGGGGNKDEVWSSTVRIQFSNPRPLYLRISSLEVYSDNIGDSRSVTMVRGGPQSSVVLAPTIYDFGTTNTGDPLTHTFTVTVSGNAPTGIGEVTTSDPQFTVANDTCSDALLDPAGTKSCTFDVVFNPTKSGPQVATLKIFSDVTANLSGSGLKPVIGVSQSALDFGTTTVGDTSTAQTVTVSNTGEGTLKVGEVKSDSANFTVTENNCAGKALANGESCTISIAASPTAAGSLQGVVTIATNDADTPSKEIQVQVVADLASIEASPTDLTFADTKVGTATATQTITVKSNGPGTLVIGTVALSGTDSTSFQIVDDGCSQKKLKLNETCTITVRAAPLVAAALVAGVSIPSNADGVPMTTVGLSGKGLSAPALRLEPTAIDFGDVAAGGTSTAKVVTLTSYGTEGVTVSAISPSDTAHFSVDLNGGTSACGTLPKTLKPGESCTITVTFSPEAEQTYNGTLSVESSHAGGTLQATLTGKGTAEPNIEVTPASHDFGSINVGKSSSALEIKIANTLNSILSVTQIGIGANADFSLDLNGGSNPCASQVKVLKPNESCSVTITFAPTSTGAKNAKLTVASNDPDTPTVEVALTGTGIATPEISAAPMSIDFGSVTVGGTSATKTVTIKNQGSGPLTISKLTSDSAQVEIVAGDSNDCGTLPKILAPNESCSITLQYRPTLAGSLSANLAITSDDPTTPELKIALSGAGDSSGTTDVVEPNADTQGDTSGGSKKGGGCSTAGDAEPGALPLLALLLGGLVALRRRRHESI